MEETEIAYRLAVIDYATGREAIVLRSLVSNAEADLRNAELRTIDARLSHIAPTAS